MSFINIHTKIKLNLHAFLDGIKLELLNIKMIGFDLSHGNQISNNIMDHGGDFS